MGVAPLALLLLAAAPAPGPTTFRNVADSVAPSLVHLVCASGQTATGVIVGGGGQVLAPASLCKAETVVAVASDGSTRNAKRVKVSAALGLALWQLPAGSYPAAAIGDARRIGPGSWVVLVGQGERAQQHAGATTSARRGNLFYTDAAALPGSGVFALDGRLVGFALARARHRRTPVVAVDAVQAWLAGGAR